MNNPIIIARNISKQYHIGSSERANRSLRETITDVFAAPLRNFKNLRRLTKIDEGKDDIIWALKDISFDVQSGEIVGIIGRNGAGKSTLLKILSRITEPSFGEIMLRGRVASLLEVGTGFHPELTGRENIYLNGTILGMKKAEIDRKFDEIVAFSEIEKFLDTPVKRYSSGMYVRLAFAVAAHLDPEILLVDEVLAVGDAAFQNKCLGKIRGVAKEGRTVLIVSHNLGSITALCNRCIWLGMGKIQEEGDPKQVVEKYCCENIELMKTSLSSRTDRTGNGEVRLTDCSMSRVPGGAAINDIFTGDELYITITFEAFQDTEVFIGVQVSDSLGNKVTSFNSREGGYQPLLKSGLNQLVLHIPWMSLLEGRYSLQGAVVKVENAASCDRIDNMMSFTVYPKDFFKTSAPFRAIHGVAFIPHTWQNADGNTVHVMPESFINTFRA